MSGRRGKNHGIRFRYLLYIHNLMKSHNCGMKWNGIIFRNVVGKIGYIFMNSKKCFSFSLWVRTSVWRITLKLSGRELSSLDTAYCYWHYMVYMTFTCKLEMVTEQPYSQWCVITVEARVSWNSWSGRHLLLWLGRIYNLTLIDKHQRSGIEL